jgi:hypothetical protein
MKYASMCVLCLIGLAIIVMAILPSLANLVAGFGIELPGRLSRTWEGRLAQSYPVILLIVGLVLLVPVVYALWRAVHSQ